MEQPPANVQSPQVFLKAQCWDLCSFQSTLMVLPKLAFQQTLSVFSMLYSHGLIYRQFYNHSSPSTVKQLYLSLVRPHLEYACQLWDPYTQNDVNKLKSVQKFALKLVSHRWDAGYEELTRLVNVPMLSERWLHLKLVQVYRILHGLCDFPDDILQIQLVHSSRLARAQTLHCPFARTNYYYNSFVPSSIRAWNSLEEDLLLTQVSNHLSWLLKAAQLDF